MHIYEGAGILIYRVTPRTRVETKNKVQHAAWQPLNCAMCSMQAKQSAVCSHASLQLHHAACRASHLQHAPLQLLDIIHSLDLPRTMQGDPCPCATCIMQTCRPQQTLGSFQEALGSFQEVVGSFQEALGSFQEAVGSFQDAVGSSQEAVGSSHKTLGSGATPIAAA